MLGRSSNHNIPPVSHRITVMCNSSSKCVGPMSYLYGQAGAYILDLGAWYWIPQHMTLFQMRVSCFRCVFRVSEVCFVFQMRVSDVA